MVQGGSPGADARTRQLRAAPRRDPREPEVTASEIDRDLARLGDPTLIIPSSVMWAAWGRRPVEES